MFWTQRSIVIISIFILMVYAQQDNDDMITQDMDLRADGTDNRRPQSWHLATTQLPNEMISGHSTDYQLMGNLSPQSSPDRINGQQGMQGKRKRRRRRKRPQKQQQQQQEQQHFSEVEDRKQTLPPEQYWPSEKNDDSEVLQQEPDQSVMFLSVEATQMVQPTQGIQVISNSEDKVNSNDAADESEKKTYHKWNNRQEIIQEPVKTPIQELVKEPVNYRPSIKERKSYSEAKREKELQNSTPSRSGTVTDLKNLLKRTGGLSLSEILQQQNLSLDDLIKGKETALRALQNTAAPYFDSGQYEFSTKPAPRRIPPSKRFQPSVKRKINSPTRQEESSKPTRRIPSFGKPKTVTGKPALIVTELNDENVVQTIPNFTGKFRVNEAKTEDSPETIINIITVAPSISSNDRLQFSRLPPMSKFQPKPIKEISSGIRPDLDNLNIRNRLFFPRQRPDGRITTKYGLGYNRLMKNLTVNANKIEMAPAEEIQDESEDVTTFIPQTTTTTPTSDFSNVQSFPEIVRGKYIFNRQPVRPHLRPNVDVISSTTTTTIETTTVLNITPTTESPEIETENYPTITEDQFNGNQHDRDEQNTNQAVGISDDQQKSDDTRDATKEESISQIEHIFDDKINSERDEAAQAYTSRIDSLLNNNLNQLDMIENIIKNTEKNIIEKIPLLTDVTERNPSLFFDITSARTVDDRTDILELLSDSRSGGKLFKVLAQRNMSLEQLIDHRQRGSSQLHLQAIYNNKTKPTRSGTRDMGKLDIVTAFDNFPNFNLETLKSVKPDEIKTDSEGSSYFTSITNIKPTDEIFKEGRAIKTLNKPRDGHFNWEKIPSLPINGQVSPVDNNHLENVRTPSITSRRAPPSLDPISTIGRGEQIENEIARAHDLLDLELSGHGFRRYPIVDNAKLPMGVRSAIIASASIVVISLLIFIIIFAACRWRQRRKKKFHYNDNFQAIRSRLPILTREESLLKRGKSSPPSGVYHASGTSSGSDGSNLNRISNSNKLNTMDPNSPEVQEYLYDAMRKQHQYH